jgi:hypothetical protein
MSEFNKPTQPPTPMQEAFDDAYRSGWNSALEMAAYKLEHEFVKSFGADTLSSIAIYIKGMKK